MILVINCNRIIGRNGNNRCITDIEIIRQEIVYLVKLFFNYLSVRIIDDPDASLVEAQIICYLSGNRDS
jgi:hypothetical protein